MATGSGFTEGINFTLDENIRMMSHATGEIMIVKGAKTHIEDHQISDLLRKNIIYKVWLNQYSKRKREIKQGNSLR
jgi:hypothetical protein